MADLMKRLCALFVAFLFAWVTCEIVAAESAMESDSCNFADLSSLGMPGERHAQVGILIRDLATGDVVANVGAERNYVPASVMKSVTTASALRLLGRDMRFATRYLLRGSMNGDGVFAGNLVVVGCGDPTLDSGEFASYAGSVDSVLVHLKRLGVKRLTGSVEIKETMSDTGAVPQWEIDDVAWAYGAGLFGLNYKDNVFVLTPATGKTEPFVPGLSVRKHEAKKDAGVDLVRGVGSDVIDVWGGSKVWQKGYTVRSTMPNPASVYRHALIEGLRKGGIEVGNKCVDEKGKESAASTQLYTHYSPSLIEILRNLMVHSNNLFAEGVLRAIAPNGSRGDAIKKVVRLWNDSGLESSYITMRDGSGLARVDRLSPEFISDMLQYMCESKWADDYLSCFAVAGVNGTVRKLLAKTRLEGRLALKSGSMNGVLCYAGYKLDDAGKPTHTVVVMVNSYFCSSSRLRELIEAYLLRAFPEMPTDEGNIEK